IHPDDREGLRGAVEKARAEGAAYRHEYRVVRPDGSVHWVVSRGRFFYDAAGRPVRMRGVVVEVTDRKQVEDARRGSEERFRALVENAFDGIALIGPDTTILYANPSNTRVVGFSPDEIVGRPGLGEIHPDDRTDAFAVFQDVLQTPGRQGTTTTRVRHKDGSWRWVEAMLQNALANPHIGAVIVNFRDVS